MAPHRNFKTFAYKGANFRIACDRTDVVRAKLVSQREALEAYISQHPAFATSFAPLPLLPDAPESARRMAAAAGAVGVGPMAAVAGTMAQLAVEAAVAAGSSDVIVENGGDIYMACASPIIIGLHSGSEAVGDRLALRIAPDATPLAICSSSGRMGHSDSLGNCDLATVVALDAALADAAATYAANRVRDVPDVDAALKTVAAIDGVQGLLIVQGDRIGLVGQLPELIRNADPDLAVKITRDPQFT